MTSDLPCFSSVYSAIQQIVGAEEGTRLLILRDVAINIIRDDITWGRIAILLHVACKVAVRVGPILVPLVLSLVSLVGSISESQSKNWQISTVPLNREEQYLTSIINMILYVI